MLAATADGSIVNPSQARDDEKSHFHIKLLVRCGIHYAAAHCGQHSFTAQSSHFVSGTCSSCATDEPTKPRLTKPCIS